MFPFSITIANVEDLDKVLCALGHRKAPATLTAGDAAADLAGTRRPDNHVEAPGKSSAAVTAPSPRTAAAAPSPSAQPGAAPATPTTATEPGVAASSAPVRADVSKAAVALALKNKPKIIEILAQFGAKGVKEVPDDKLAEIYPLIQAELGS